jgi:acetyltransferase
MTVRNLHHVLDPQSIALCGASERAGSVGAVVLANLLANGFEGPIWPVNPKHKSVQGLPCYRSVEAMPGAPELALIATPPRAVPPTVAALGARGTRLAVLVGGGRLDDDLLRMTLEAARPHLLRLIGPGSAGIMVPGLKLNAGLSETMAAPGRLGLISQSAAIASALVDWAAARGIGFSHVASLGKMADVDVGDYLDLLATDRRVGSILLYLETVPAPRKFMSAARAAARLKPVVAIKAGRHAAGARAAMLHTGALAGAADVAEAALRRAGVLRVLGLGELFEAAEIIGRFRPLPSGRLAIVTNSGAAGVLAVDRLMDVQGDLAALAEETVAALSRDLGRCWTGGNPVELGPDAGPDRYRAALAALGSASGVDAILAMYCPTGLSDPAAVASAVADAVEAGRIGGKPVLSCWLGGEKAQGARRTLRDAGVASYGSPAPAAAAVAHLTEWGEAQAALLRVPDRGEPALETPAAARAGVAAVLGRVANEGRRVLFETEANAILEAYGVPMVETSTAADADEVAALAEAQLADVGAVAVKLLSRDIVHKAEVGGVVLDLRTAEEAGQAARAIAARLAERRPDARLDGFIVQPMVRRSLAEEVIAGIGRDAVFGPVILFGAGGLKVETVRDTAVALPPLDVGLAGELVGRTRIGRSLAARFEDATPGAAVLRRVLVSLSHLTEDFPCILAVDVNPLLADGDGAIAVDASIEIEPGDVDRPGPNPDFAIRPYPAAWTRAVTLRGEDYVFRAIRPTDAFLYPAFLERLDPEAIRMRFLAPRRHFPDEMGLRLTQLDYDRDMAFVAIDEQGALAGVARMAADPHLESAEYALIVRSDLGGRGLGRALLSHLVEYARAEGLRRLEGAILGENKAMIALVKKLGFTTASDPSDRSVLESRLDLAPRD